MTIQDLHVWCSMDQRILEGLDNKLNLHPIPFNHLEKLESAIKMADQSSYSAVVGCLAKYSYCSLRGGLEQLLRDNECELIDFMGWVRASLGSSDPASKSLSALVSKIRVINSYRSTISSMNDRYLLKLKKTLTQ
ncbi:TPA: hypothetical protein I7730_14105 [Vibrio vulnificus]|uniref:Uncharacterized protein n=1 Tax=Vibrio vulnificus TaxID=672 RepID=A0A8H9N194_VIBVL|nr:hypothetical protein [Vibrio vulnificus]